MSFTEPTGPPATAKQLGYLESLLRKAGYASYAEARRPLGLTARQGRGKFTLPEASALIDRLTAESNDEEAEAEDGAGIGVAEAGAAVGAGTGADRPLAGFPSEQLAAELRARGWQLRPPG